MDEYTQMQNGDKAYTLDEFFLVSEEGGRLFALIVSEKQQV